MEETVSSFSRLSPELLARSVVKLMKQDISSRYKLSKELTDEEIFYLKAFLYDADKKESVENALKPEAKSYFWSVA